MSKQREDHIKTKAGHALACLELDAAPLSIAIREALEELERAGEKFPTFPADPIHGGAVVAEEAGELTQASLQHFYGGGQVSHMREEAIQTAAMALRFLVNWPAR